MSNIADLVKLNTIIRLHKESLDFFVEILDSYMGGIIDNRGLKKKMEDYDMSKFTIEEDEKRNFLDWLTEGVEPAPVIDATSAIVKEKVEEVQGTSPLAQMVEDEEAFYIIPKKIAERRAGKENKEIIEDY